MENREIGNTALHEEIKAQQSIKHQGPRIPARMIPGVCSWICLLGLFGVIGGMDNETIGFMPGMIWAVICLAAWIASLAAGGWLK